MERCPCCNARLTGAVCPRCQADLGGVLGSEHWARHWLSTAAQFWFAHEPQMAMSALTKAVKLEQTPSALIFRDFITRRQIRQIVALLAKRKYKEAAKLLALLRDLNPDYEFTRQLYGYTEYLPAIDKIEY